MKKFFRLAILVPTLLLAAATTTFFGLKAYERSLIEENEALVHSIAQSILPALMVNDTQQVSALLKTLESYPSIDAAELISGYGLPLATYARADFVVDPMRPQFELASVQEDTLLVKHLNVTAPITFDTQIIANLHIAVNLWPVYMRMMMWMGILLIVPTCFYVFVKQTHLKLRFEKTSNGTGSDSGGQPFSVNQALLEALNDADISLEYQPIKRVSDGGIFGMEVVVRWLHPSGQTLHISPSDFIALAEKSDLFLPFSDWILTSACQQAAQWQHQYGPLVMSLNISATQLKDPSFYSKVRSACEAAQYPHQLLEFEVDESILLQSKDALALVEICTQQGMSLTVDGFGLSSRSVELLQNTSIKKVKFASSLVKNLALDACMRDFVQSFVDVALIHDIQLMASGIHSDNQLSIMRKMGLIVGQGPHYGHPMPAAQFTDLLERQQSRDGSSKQSINAHMTNPVLGY